MSKLLLNTRQDILKNAGEKTAVDIHNRNNKILWKSVAEFILQHSSGHLPLCAEFLFYFWVSYPHMTTLNFLMHLRFNLPKHSLTHDLRLLMMTPPSSSSSITETPVICSCLHCFCISMRRCWICCCRSLCSFSLCSCSP